MTRYSICFACTLPGEPGCGCPDNDFFAEHGFEGSAAEAIKTAERVSLMRYHGDFQWWIVTDPNAVVDLEVAIEDNNPSINASPRLSDELKRSGDITYHGPDDLASILREPTYIEVSLFPPGIKDSIQFGYRNWEFHGIEFDLYNDGFLVDRGKGKPGSSGYGKPPNTTSSLFTVEEMIYSLNLVYGNKVSHILRIEDYTDFHTKELVEMYPLKLDVYEFRVDGAIMGRYGKEHRDFLDKKERCFYDLCERLEASGTTL